MHIKLINIKGKKNSDNKIIYGVGGHNYSATFLINENVSIIMLMREIFSYTL